MEQNGKGYGTANAGGAGNVYANAKGKESNGNGNGNGNGYHWDSQVEVFQHADAILLRDAVNEFCPGRFVVGIQTHLDQLTKLWTAFVYYKVRA